MQLNKYLILIIKIKILLLLLKDIFFTFCINFYNHFLVNQFNYFNLTHLVN